MGVIRKKAGTRGTEGGLKYICDVCSVDITSTVRIHCADPTCRDFDLCVPCFANGSACRDHNPATHSFSVIEQHSIPIFTPDWGADEELALLEGAEVYGLGSWADIADHVGGFRSKDEVRDHYISTYVDSPHFPLPARADPHDLSLLDEVPRDVFQARKKRRIEDRKEAQRTAQPSAPKQKPTSSVPSCHEVQGYMPGRLEFETEFYNDAEEAVQHMQFDPGNGLDAQTGELEPEMELKMVVMDIYNSRLTSRALRKKLIFEHHLLEYRKNLAIDKKRTKEERDLSNKVKPFARMMNHEDFSDWSQSLEYEHNLRQAIAQLQDWRRHGVGDLKAGEKYELEKAQRAARPVGTGSFDRFPGVRPGKASAPVEVPPATVALTAPDLPERLKTAIRPVGTAETTALDGSTTHTTTKASLTNGVSAHPHRSLYTTPAIPGVNPFKLPLDPLAPAAMPSNPALAADLHLLTAEERELCAALRLAPKPYLAIKEAFLREATKGGGALRKKNARDVCRIDATKSARLYDFFVRSGWVQKV